MQPISTVLEAREILSNQDIFISIIGDRKTKVNENSKIRITLFTNCMQCFDRAISLLARATCNQMISPTTANATNNLMSITPVIAWFIITKNPQRIILIITLLKTQLIESGIVLKPDAQLLLSLQ